MSDLPPQHVAQVLRRAAGRPVLLWIATAGPSMEPAIPAGARVRVAAGVRPRRGEIWAFCDQEAKVVVHRCHGRRGPMFVFQGDVAAGPDEPVPPDRLVGRVTAVAFDGRCRRVGSADRWWGALAMAWRRARGLTVGSIGRTRAGEVWRALRGPGHRKEGAAPGAHDVPGRFSSPAQSALALVHRRRRRR